MVEVIGFNHKPFSVILWYKGDEAVNKTICYDEDEEADMIDRLNSEKSYRSMYDAAEIIRENITFFIKKGIQTCQIG